MLTLNVNAAHPQALPGDYVILAFRGGQDVTPTPEGIAALGCLHPTRFSTISSGSAQEKAQELGWGAEASGSGLSFQVAELLYVAEIAW